ncbi:MAG: hypothetical protein RMH97_10015 [Verrucomicrobiales bacterium]|nr:hypothetical protein [Verrucomicrobiales bacterium]
MNIRNGDAYNRLLETLWRRELTEAEAAELRELVAAHPNMAEDLDLETRLTAALNQLPDKPVAPNFTARVLAAVERKPAQTTARLTELFLALRRLGWLPNTALAILALALALLGLHQYRVATRARIAQSVAVMAKVGQLPGPDVLIDYDTIWRLGQLPPPDTELLTLLK